MTPWPRRLTGGLAGAAVIIGVITVLARLAGFGRTYAFSQTVTTSCLSQAYFTATQLPSIVYEIVAGGALAGLVVPVLAGPAERGDREEVRRIASALLTWIVLLMVPLSALLAVLSRPVMELMVGGDLRDCARPGIVGVGGDMMAIMAPQMVMYGVAVVLYGLLQSHRRFVAPALAPLMSSLVVIGAYLAYAPLGRGFENDLARLPVPAELTLSIGTALGGVAMAATAGIAAWRLRLGLRPTLRFPDGVGGRVRRLAVAGLATVVAQQLSALLVVRLSYEGTGGALANYQYAWAMYLLPWAILAVPIATSAFPMLSARLAEPGEFDRITASTTRAVILVSCAGAAVLAAVAVPAAAVFNPGQAVQRDVLAAAALAFAPGLLGYGLVAHLGRVLFACRRGRMGAIAIVTGWLVVMAADVALVFTVDREGVVAALGLGNAAGMTVAGALLLATLVRARGRAAVRGVPRALCAGIAGGAAGGAAGDAVAGVLGTGGGGQVSSVGVAALAALVAAAVFAAIAFVIDGRDLRAVLSRKVARHD